MGLKAQVGAVMRGLHRLATLGQETEHRITNFQMYRRLSRYRPAKPSQLRVLSISGSWELCFHLGFVREQVTNTTYPDVNLLDLPYADNSFDVVISDQVLEHVEGDLKQAVNETFRVLRPGGLAIHTTCMMVPIHGTPGDYWRVTPSGMRWLAADRADVLEADGWGSPFARIYASSGTAFLPIPTSPRHPLHWLATYNWASWPMITWVVARKREAPDLVAASR